jgi:hypothetical protein
MRASIGLRGSWVSLVTGGLLLVAGGCGGGGGGDTKSKWAAIRTAAAPQVALTDEFYDPSRQPLAVDGWEDGIFISRDGLHLFAVYAPADLLAFTIAGADQNHASEYFRGPTFGMDLRTNPAGSAYWIQGDIIHATRPDTSASFKQWHLAPMGRHTWSEGAPVAQGPDGGTWDLFVHTTNEHHPDYKAHIALAQGAALDPAAVGTLLPAPVTTDHTEDNPHVERLDTNNLVLFFDSDDRPGDTVAAYPQHHPGGGAAPPVVRSRRRHLVALLHRDESGRRQARHLPSRADQRRRLECLGCGRARPRRRQYRRGR